MLKPRRLVVLLVAITVSLSACDNETDSKTSRKGDQGQSCTASSDCNDNLVCIDQVCLALGSEDSKNKDAGVATQTIYTRGQVGESCRARSDCESNLTCIHNVCTSSVGIEGNGIAMGEPGESCMSYSDCRSDLVCVDQVCSNPEALLIPEDASVATVGISNRGESCDTRADCKQGLICVDSTCQLAEFDLNPSDKECVLIECREKTDCCDANDIDITVSPCSSYDTSCQSLAQPNIYCDQFTLHCTCEGYDCVDEKCVREPPCEDSSICNLYSTTKIFCSDNNKCVECTEDSDCNEDESCEDNQCIGDCKTDLDCDFFHECQSGVCVEVGCKSDRECIALTGNVFAICEDKECRQPCETDLECSSPDNFQFSICIDGYCENVGCETAEECRLRMNKLEPDRSNAIDIECR